MKIFRKKLFFFKNRGLYALWLIPAEYPEISLHEGTEIEVCRLKEWEKFLASGKIDHYRMEKKFIHKDGQTLHAILDANLIRDISGKAIYFLGSVVDITERRQAEMDLQSQKKLLEGVFDSIKDVIGVQLPDHTIVQYNRAGYELLGLTKDQVKGKKCYELLGRQDPCDICATTRSFASRTMEKVETYMIELDRHFLCTSNPILDADGNIKLIIEQLTDITEKKKIDEQLNQAQKMESVGRLAGGVAHDFNNMLGVILGHLEFALEKVEKNDDINDDLKEIRRAARRSADLTKQLLTFARKQVISPKRLDLNDTVESMLNMLRRLIGENIDLIWQPVFDLWPVKMDPSQIDQILANLCVNATRPPQARQDTHSSLSARIHSSPLTWFMTSPAMRP